MKYDACAFVGHWPFWKVKKGSFSDLKAAHEKNGIGGGLVGCLESIFFNDPYEGDEECAALLDGSYVFAGTVNPFMPGAEEDLERCLNILRAGAIRLYPSDHGYDCDAPEVISLCKKAGALGLRVAVTVRTEDIRLDYLFKQRETSLEGIARLIESCPDTAFLISNAYIRELKKLRDSLLACENAWADTARFKDGMFALEEALKVIPAEKLIFGSGAPLLAMSCMLTAVMGADIPDGQKHMIMRENYLRFMDFGK
jgi:predicted TIM-barrel fold metal-dependent hydrolase